MRLNTCTCLVKNGYVLFTGYISHLSLHENFSISLLNRRINKSNNINQLGTFHQLKVD